MQLINQVFDLEKISPIISLLQVKDHRLFKNENYGSFTT